jgi:WD40 repeat protein
MRILFLSVPLLAMACATPPIDVATSPAPAAPVDSISWNADTLIGKQEKHLVHLKKLTWGGNNAEAYWSFNGHLLSFQSDFADWHNECDQIHVFDPFHDDLRSHPPTKLSLGGGRTTCSYFLPGDSLVLFASTQSGGASCPAVPEHRPGGKYIWPIYPDYEIYVSDLKGNMRKQLTNSPGYDAEATVSPKGDRIVFTSMRDGDIELYTMNVDGSDVKRVTNTPGYDGGAFFSPDGTKLVWRASRPKTKEDLDEYFDLLKKGQVQPTQMELFVANADGTDAKQITSLGQANWAPCWHPDGKRILFASNHTSERGFPFTLYLVNIDGTGLEQVTYSDAFDAFPSFSPDGRFLVFSSNRGGKNRETNLFMAEWKD